MNIVKELFVFTLKQARAALFAGLFLGLLIITNHFSIPGLARNDLLFIGAVIIQILMIITGFETIDEAKTIALFHGIGLCLELFKTNPAIGSWAYADGGVLRIATVPLYSGFMYASIGSYMAQSWKIMKLKLVKPPSYLASIALAFLIYANFFTNHWLYDFRWWLMIAVMLLYIQTYVLFQVTIRTYKLWLPAAFVLIAFFVWIAENIATFVGAWVYPHQKLGWTVVEWQKISSWALLVIISFMLIAYLKHKKYGTLH